MGSDAQIQQTGRDPSGRRAVAPREPADRLAWLLACTAAGDRAAFRALYESTSAKLFGTIRLIVGDHIGAEDVLQDAFVRIWERASSYDPGRGRPMTWLITIARHGAIDHIRKGANRVMVDLDEVGELRDHQPTADVLVFASRDAQRMTAVLDSLPEHVAATIRSTYFDGCTYEELATRSGIAAGTLKSWVRRGLAKMRTELSLWAAA